MNTTSLFVIAIVLAVMGAIPWKSKVVDNEFILDCRLFLATLACVFFAAGLTSAMILS